MGGYKFKTQPSVALLYTSNEQSENEVKKIIAFTITSKGILKRVNRSARLVY